MKARVCIAHLAVEEVTPLRLQDTTEIHGRRPQARWDRGVVGRSLGREGKNGDNAGCSCGWM
jgi:hypothetical protein